MPDKRTIESMLFNSETTYKSDYHWLYYKPQVDNVYNPKPSRIRAKPQRLKDINTLTPLKEDIPFYLLHKKNEILTSDPRLVQQRVDKQVDIYRESIMKTRPRLVMTPAVSLDDIEDPRARQILCADMYLSDMAKGLKEAVEALPPCSKVTAPLPGLPAPSDPIFLPKLQFPFVSPEWRMETVSWDNKQLRGYCDSTKEFWLRRPLSKCKACKETAIMDNHRKMLLRKNMGR